MTVTTWEYWERLATAVRVESMGGLKVRLSKSSMSLKVARVSPASEPKVAEPLTGSQKGRPSMSSWMCPASIMAVVDCAPAMFWRVEGWEKALIGRAPTPVVLGAQGGLNKEKPGGGEN